MSSRRPCNKPEDITVKKRLRRSASLNDLEDPREPRYNILQRGRGRLVSPIRRTRDLQGPREQHQDMQRGRGKLVNPIRDLEGPREPRENMQRGRGRSVNPIRGMREVENNTRRTGPSSFVNECALCTGFSNMLTPASDRDLGSKANDSLPLARARNVRRSDYDIGSRINDSITVEMERREKNQRKLCSMPEWKLDRISSQNTSHVSFEENKSTPITKRTRPDDSCSYSRIMTSTPTSVVSSPMMDITETSSKVVFSSPLVQEEDKPYISNFSDEEDDEDPEEVF